MPIKVPKDREVPFGAITPAPVRQQELFITSNWRIVRPVIDHEKCTRCFTCYASCPDSCWSYNEKEDQMEWNWKFCKGCQICIHECPVDADGISGIRTVDFSGSEGGVDAAGIGAGIAAPLLGAMAKATGMVKKESLAKIISDVSSMERGYKEVKLQKFRKSRSEYFWGG